MADKQNGKGRERAKGNVQGKAKTHF